MPVRLSLAGMWGQRVGVVQFIMGRLVLPFIKLEARRGALHA